MINKESWIWKTKRTIIPSTFYLPRLADQSMVDSTSSLSYTNCYQVINFLLVWFLYQLPFALKFLKQEWRAQERNILRGRTWNLSGVRLWNAVIFSAVDSNFVTVAGFSCFAFFSDKWNGWGRVHIFGPVDDSCKQGQVSDFWCKILLDIHTFCNLLHLSPFLLDLFFYLHRVKPCINKRRKYLTY